MINRLFNAYVLYPFAEMWLRREIRSKVDVLRREGAKSFQERRAAQRKRLSEILRIAATEVPYYRDLFEDIGFHHARVVENPECVRELPYLTKEIIRSQGRRMLNERYPLDSLHQRRTGGSTGPSALVYYSRDGLDWTAAVNLYALEWAGKRRHMKEAHLASRFPQVFPWKDRIREMVKSWALNRVNIYTDSLRDEDLERIWRRLKRIRPYLLQGHPSTMYALASFLRRKRYDAAGILRVFESTGELLDRQKREAIQKAFGCRIVNRYGNAEFGVVAYQNIDDDRGWMRVLDSVVWPELAASGDTLPELVFTGLTNPAMPLIRYRTGDLGDLVEEEDGLYLKEVVGRVHDLVRVGDKVYPTHYVQDLLDRIGGIAEFQVEEKEGQPLVLRLVAEASASRDQIVRQLQSWWGNGVAVEFVDFPGLRRQGRLGKFGYVVKADPG